ncbi:MAG: hypothetical protein ACI4F9_09355 [Lachnospiraceae bacterium]
MEEIIQKENFALQQFLQDNQLSMLESIMPYIGEHLRKPLALSIKFLEIKKILTEFDDEEKLSACGLENSPPNIDSLLTALRNNSSPEMAEQIDQIITMRNIMKMYQTYTELMKNNPDIFSSSYSSSNSNNGNTQEILLKLLPLLMANQSKEQNENKESDSFLHTLNEILKVQEQEEE